MLKPNEMIRREDDLMGFEDANDMPGKLKDVVYPLNFSADTA